MTGAKSFSQNCNIQGNCAMKGQCNEQICTETRQYSVATVSWIDFAQLGNREGGFWCDKCGLVLVGLKWRTDELSGFLPYHCSN